MASTDIWKYAYSGIKRLMMISSKEKFAFCVFFGFTFAILSAQSRVEFIDKFIAGIIYFFWALFLLPTLKANLSVQLLWDMGVILLTLIAGDVMYFGLYCHAKNMWFAESTPIIVEYQSSLFFVSVVRITVILFCLVTSSSAFIRNNFGSLPYPKPKKDVPTPHKMKLRSSSK